MEVMEILENLKVQIISYLDGHEITIIVQSHGDVSDKGWACDCYIEAKGHKEVLVNFLCCEKDEYIPRVYIDRVFVELTKENLTDLVITQSHTKEHDPLIAKSEYLTKVLIEWLIDDYHTMIAVSATQRTDHEAFVYDININTINKRTIKIHYCWINARYFFVHATKKLDFSRATLLGLLFPMPYNKTTSDTVQHTMGFTIGSKVTPVQKKDNTETLTEMMGFDYCLLGFTENRYVLIEWEKRGGIDMMMVDGDIYSDLKIVM